MNENVLGSGIFSGIVCDLDNKSNKLWLVFWKLSSQQSDSDCVKNQNNWSRSINYKILLFIWVFFKIEIGIKIFYVSYEVILSIIFPFCSEHFQKQERELKQFLLNWKQWTIVVHIRILKALYVIIILF